ncbi:PIN domain-containing protein [Gaiella sp.]|uniref:PIN domain-containing protein n=1 Tax=Gaiella sp. TaxID=2663207 RepID=UPI002E35932A|nr:PIN domain-containing protein [Gaiella sp.]HEX5583818.1 PIN domain-containing protein [Gaiella sp.]
MRIVLDTNALNADLRLEKAQGRLLIAAARNQELTLVVPEVVVLEATTLVRRKADDLAKSVTNLRREYADLGTRFEGAPLDAEETAATYETALRRRLRDSGTSVPTPPNVPHLDVARRAMDRRKPFDAKGRGYRDTLIWLQVLAEAAEDEVVFVTDDQDFGTADGVLDPQLADELDAAGLARDRVRISKSLAKVVRQYVEPSAQAITRLQALLDDDDFRSGIYEAVNDSLLYREVERPDDEDLRTLDVTDVQIDSVQDVHGLEIDEAWVDEDRLAFNIGGTATIEAAFYPLKSNLAGADTPDVSVHDWDWNEWVAQATKLIDVGFEGFGSYDPESSEVEMVDVWLVY